MSIRADLRTYLLTKSSVTDLVGQRIYPQQAPEGAAFPRIIYAETGGQRTGSLGGANLQIKTSFSLACEAEDGDEAVAVADALANVLDYYQGTMNVTTVQGVFVTKGGDSIEPPIAADEKSVKTATIDIDLWYESAVPTYV